MKQRQQRKDNHMTKEKHKARHAELHKALDELLADWIGQTGGMPSESSIFDLVKWSNAQTENPTEDATR